MLIDESSWISSPRVPDHNDHPPGGCGCPLRGPTQLLSSSKMELLKMELLKMRLLK
jgi:hypothetical protein